MQEGLVIRTTGSWYRVMVNGFDMEVVDCRLRGNYRLRGNKQTNPVAVGDRVQFEIQDDGTGVIHEVADRSNYIVRRATKLSKQTHVIAANIDLLCVVATLGLPRTSTGFIDRLLVTAEAYHIPACVVFNKCDLLQDPELRAAQDEVAAIYRGAGYTVLEVSALTGSGIADLKAAIAGKTVLFSGHSGVGKSALLNAISPDLGLKVGQISDWSLKGKHTTTFAEIFPIRVMGYGLEVMDNDKVSGYGLEVMDNDTSDAPSSITHNPSPITHNPSSITYNPSSITHNPSPITHNPSSITYLIDTPGIKEFGMVDFTPQELSHFFPEMRSRLHDCHFANCTHRHEPQCAIKKAVEDGFISEERYRNYLSIVDGIDEA